MSDPWGFCDTSDNKCLEKNIELKQEIINEFEDNFVLKKDISLPDSEQYLKSLEKKLFKIKNNPDVLKQLAKKREDCFENLLNSNSTTTTWTNNDVELDDPISSHGDSAVQEIYRHICPVQPLNVGEIVHIVKYDQLEEQNSINDQDNQKDKQQS